MKALFLVNGLGLGNSTRCHAIIQRLARHGVTVAVASSGNGLWYFEGRPEIASLTRLDALYYASDGGRISIVRTLASLGDFWKIAQRNTVIIDALLDTFEPDVVIIDSVYTIVPMRRRHIPVVALNNADVVHLSYRRFPDRPRSILFQFYAIEELDYRFHRWRPDLVLSPSLDHTLPELGGTFRRIGPIVRLGYEASIRAGPIERVLIMLSGSRFGSSVSLTGRAFQFAIDVVGREAPGDSSLPAHVQFHGRLRDNRHIVDQADVVVANGGFSAVSEAFAMRKPLVVLPIPNHAEQWINARTIVHLGVGVMAREDAIVQGMTTAIERIDELRAAYARLPSVRDGAAEAAEAIAELIAFRPGRSP